MNALLQGTILKSLLTPTICSWIENVYQALPHLATLFHAYGVGFWGFVAFFFTGILSTNFQVRTLVFLREMGIPAIEFCLPRYCARWHEDLIPA